MADPPAAALGDVKRQAVVDHVLAAARTYVLANGLDATMDELADATGVSRRTLFRHFVSREKLLATAFEAGMSNYLAQLPVYAGDLNAWLEETCTEMHRMNAAIGPGFFDLASRADLAPELLAVETRRRNDFRGAMRGISRTLWTATGRRGRPDATLTATVTAHLSPHFTAALTIDAGGTWSDAADIAYTAILAATGTRPDG